MQLKWSRPLRPILSARAIVTALILLGSVLAPLHVVRAADGPQPAPAAAEQPQPQLETVVVTGTLIPTSKAVMVPTPIVTISADDLKSDGFTSIATALQQSVFATGSVQPSDPNTFTPGARTISMFGLDPAYTKLLINGRPLGQYPALYNGSDMISSIGGIPSELIDHIDILPGGQSSIYGSDAIAGVVNVVMKTKMDGPTADARYGWDQLGGGRDLRLALADGVSLGKLNVVGGVQYEDTAPIWGYTRPLTSTYNYGGLSPGIAARDWMLFGYYGDPTTGDTYYHSTLVDPSQCGNVASQFNNSVGVRYRPDDHGYYCGSYDAGEDTLGNGESQVQGYISATFDVNAHLQLYANTLLNHDVNQFSTGAGSFQTIGMTSSPWYYFEDPRFPEPGQVGDYLNLQHIFSPEEAGGLGNTLSEDDLNGERFEVGGRGDIGPSNWHYDASLDYEQDKLTERIFMQFTTPISNYYNGIMGPQLGVDPAGGDAIYEPNYAAFFQPISPATYAGFSGHAISQSYTESSLARGQLTNTDLFALPGGNAALAVVGEGGDEGWNYSPDPRYATQETYLYTSVGGSGRRSRYAGTMELRLPVIKDGSITASGRYDKFNVTGGDFQKFTYNLGAEYHPVRMLTFRARYGTAFKAPTLADEFQGVSGAYTSTVDYYQCALRGYTGSNLENCPANYLSASIFNPTQGNPTLKPLTAKVWDAGLVLTPLPRLSISSDLMSWSIDNEITEAILDQVVKTESECLLGQLDNSSPTCVEDDALVTRSGSGVLEAVETPKVNQSNERVTTVLTQLNYVLPMGRLGDFVLGAAWTDMIKHTFVQFAGDQTIDLLGSPFYSTEFKSKVTLSVGWLIDKLSATAFVIRDGRTPNYLATLSTVGYATPGAAALAPYTSVNLTVQYQVLRSLQLTASVSNLFNSMPPLDNTYPNYTEGPYNENDYGIIGRQFMVEGTYKFER
ncbi:MAG TPA: TonB-dependent receptor [Steroidobacteraceae bacterium]|jgi:outer membrane receptor protein involved in Fe transport